MHPSSKKARCSGHSSGGPGRVGYKKPGLVADQIKNANAVRRVVDHGSAVGREGIHVEVEARRARFVKSCGDDGPSSDSVRPCHEHEPPWRVILAALSVFGAGVLLFNGDGKRNTICLAISLIFFAGVMLLVG